MAFKVCSIYSFHKCYQLLKPRKLIWLIKTVLLFCVFFSLGFDVGEVNVPWICLHFYDNQLFIFYQII